MLAPDNRRTLLEALRPPPGYKLDRAIGTTYSLDLQALLMAPLAFTIFGWQAEAGHPEADPLALLEAVRNYAGRIRIFCQAGQISIPRPKMLLLSYLEESVAEVVAPNRGGVFHPKLWVLRFVPPDAGAKVAYRVLCLSRNLTFDRSWDTVLVLDGQVAERSYGYSENRPLADFVAALPDLAVRAMSPQARRDVESVESELRKVTFELPEGFESVSFHPLGHRGRRKWPFAERVTRRLVVSPFLTGGVLHKLSATGANHVLISRLEELAAAEPAALVGYATVFSLAPAAEPELEEEAEELATAVPNETLTGLHAKLYVEEIGWDAHVWTGSANATEAAFERNVEFLVRLSGRRSRCGVSAFLDDDRWGIGFRPLLQNFRTGDPPTRPDPVQERLEKRLDLARSAILAARLAGAVIADPEKEAFRIELRHTGEHSGDLDQGVAVNCWPISLPPTEATVLRLDQDPATVLGPLTFEALTTFLAFELSTSEAQRSAALRFVIAVPLKGLPPDRGERLLRVLVKDRDGVLRFLFLLLAEGETDPGRILEAMQALTDKHRNGSQSSFPLFETMLRALDRHPEKLDSVARFVADLTATPEGRALLPEGFDEIWPAIAAVREEMKRR